MTFEDWWKNRTQDIMSDKEFVKQAYNAGYRLGYVRSAYDYHPCYETKRTYGRIKEMSFIVLIQRATA